LFVGVVRYGWLRSFDVTFSYVCYRCVVIRYALLVYTFPVLFPCCYVTLLFAFVLRCCYVRVCSFGLVYVWLRCCISVVTHSHAFCCVALPFVTFGLRTFTLRRTFTFVRWLTLRLRCPVTFRVSVVATFVLITLRSLRFVLILIYTLFTLRTFVCLRCCCYVAFATALLLPTCCYVVWRLRTFTTWLSLPVVYVTFVVLRLHVVYVDVWYAFIYVPHFTRCSIRVLFTLRLICGYVTRLFGCCCRVLPLRLVARALPRLIYYTLRVHVHAFLLRVVTLRLPYVCWFTFVVALRALPGFRVYGYVRLRCVDLVVRLFALRCYALLFPFTVSFAFDCGLFLRSGAHGYSCVYVVYVCCVALPVAVCGWLRCVYSTFVTALRLLVYGCRTFVRLFGGWFTGYVGLRSHLRSVVVYRLRTYVVYVDLRVGWLLYALFVALAVCLRLRVAVYALRFHVYVSFPRARCGLRVWLFATRLRTFIRFGSPFVTGLRLAVGYVYVYAFGYGYLPHGYPRCVCVLLRFTLVIRCVAVYVVVVTLPTVPLFIYVRCYVVVPRCRFGYGRLIRCPFRCG